MKMLAKGKIHERIYAFPNQWYPLYAVTGDTDNLIIDAGVNLLGPRYLEGIRELFKDQSLLRYLFITHSHYDHLGAAGYLKRRIPGLKIGAHPRIAELLQRESALETMNRLSMNHDMLYKYNAEGEDLTIRPFEIDYPLTQGEEFDLGGLTCRVYEVPGHTKDSLAFYVPEIGALFPGEAAGVLQGPDAGLIQVEFLSSYMDYCKSLEMMKALTPEIICIGHGWVLTDGDAGDFLGNSLAATFRYRRLIESYLDAAGGDVSRAIADMVRREYDESGSIFQERNAYITNLTAQVRLIAGLQE
jgi:glyoxylase-like metal-dependent hydrolase (beta-lactamase superfamily II)